MTINKQDIADAVAKQLCKDPEFRELARQQFLVESELWTIRQCCEHFKCKLTTFHTKYAPKLTKAPNVPGVKYRAKDIVELTQ